MAAQAREKHEARLEVMIMFPQATYEYQAYHVKCYEKKVKKLCLLST